AEALLDVLTGTADPSGRLAETYPQRLEPAPTAGTFPSSQRTAEYREALFSGYRYYQRAGIDVAFRFGSGLSYTSLAYSDLVVTDDTARFTLTNTGDRAGSETAQLYVGRLGDSAVPRPVRELKGFTVVHLEAGESTEVEIALTDRAFRVFHSPTGSWQVGGGDYQVAVGSNIQDLPQSVTVALSGTITETEAREAALSGAAAERYAAAEVREVSDSDVEALLCHAVHDP